MVYVDDYKAPMGKMIISHMFADTSEELLQMATQLGIDHKYIQFPGTPSECFNVCMKDRTAAVIKGARKTTFLQFTKLSDLKKRNIKRQEQGKPLLNLRIYHK